MKNFTDTDQNDSFKSQMITTMLLPDIVGHTCVAIIKNGRKFGSENAKFEEGEFYFINSDHEFSKWYRQARPYHQLFRSSRIERPCSMPGTSLNGKD